MSNILIIEDDEQVRSMLRILLGLAGYEVEDAPDGKEGLRLFQQKPFDLIITDILMPGKDGMETIIEMRREFPDVKIIAISGGGRIIPDYYLDSAKLFGAMRTLAKPFEQKELLEMVRELLQESKT